MTEVIDKAHNYTHKLEFEEEVQNEEVRRLLRIVMDLAQGLTNIYSNTVERGLFGFDRVSYEKKARMLLTEIEHSPKPDELKEVNNDGSV